MSIHLNDGSSYEDNWQAWHYIGVISYFLSSYASITETEKCNYELFDLNSSRKLEIYKEDPTVTSTRDLKRVSSWQKPCNKIRP